MTYNLILKFIVKKKNELEKSEMSKYLKYD